MREPYRRLVLRLPTPLEERVIAELWAAGVAGIETVEEGGGETVFAAYFEETTDDSTADPLDHGMLESAGVEFEAETWIEDADWMAVWRAAVLPFEVGNRFVVDAREPGEGPPAVTDGRILLRCPGWNAFGTGSHESTRLVLRLLENEAADTDLSGTRVLDVGCGTGILSFASAALGAVEVSGFDVDVASGLIAGQLRALHEGRGRFWVGSFASLAPSGCFDLALVNVLPERWIADAGALTSRLRLGGVALVSGVLATEWDRVVAQLAAHGLEVMAVIDEREWRAGRFVRIV